MLLEIVPIELITGLIFLHAEHVTPDSNEAFIAGVYRDRNQDGFVKAFSDNAEHFAIGISPLQTVLGKLRIRKVELWPRFHKSIIRDLGERKADVVELHQPLSKSMRIIQTAIVECLDATLSELKRSISSIEVGEYTLENAIFQAFDVIVQRQLQPVWHRLGFKTKRLVADLKELRKLLTFLISYDAVTFYQYLENLRAAQTTTYTAASAQAKLNLPDWMFLDAANTIFQQARARAYLGDVNDEPLAPSTTEQDGVDVDEDEEEAAFGPSATRSGRRWHPKWLPPGIEPVLEELPKWHLLREVLDEIEQEIHFSEIKQDDISPNNTILIMTGTDRSCWQVREFLSEMDDCVIGGPQDEDRIADTAALAPGRKMMRQTLQKHFSHKVSMGRMAAILKGIESAPTVNNATEKRSSSPAKPFESEALKRKVTWERSGGPANKRRRQRGGLASSVNARQSKDPVAAAELMEQEATDFADFYERALATVAGNDEDDDQSGGSLAAFGEEEAGGEAADDDESDADFEITGFNEAEFDNYFGVLNMDSLIVVRPYREDSDDNVLRELRPRFIIMYDPSPAFVRRVELYRSSTAGANPRVYFLLYAESVEEQRYLSSMRREKESFEKLIREKAMMALPLQADGRPAAEDADDRMLRSINSRIAGGQRGATKEQPRIVVDMREFKSSLPPMLYFAGIKVVPCTLTVGDYILSPQMCVERKSLTDLVQSFNSGRLFSQCEQMSVHYDHPILLIEFPQDKAFAMQTMLGTKSNAATKGGSASAAAAAAAAANPKTDPTDIDVQTKLVMLVMQFPRLKIIWSSSPYHTADIFMELKATYEEPDLTKVAAIGLEPDSNGTAVTTYENSFNQTPQDMLRNMPGITTKNYHNIMRNVRDLEELCDLSQEEMVELIGPDPGRTLWEFVNKDVRRAARNTGRARGRGGGGQRGR